MNSLDVDRLDAAAGRAMAGRTVDLLDVQRRVSRDRRGSRVKVVSWATLVAAVAVLVIALTPLGSRLSSDPEPPIPATRLQGPGALPRTVYTIPPWLPSLTETPMARAALVVDAEVTATTWGRPGKSTTAPVLVSADGSAYAALPTRAGSAVSLSRDGTMVAWAADADGDTMMNDEPPVYLHYMRTAGGPHHRVDISAGAPVQIDASDWSADGRWIAVSGFWAGAGVSGGTRGASVIDTRTDRAYKVCDCFGPTDAARFAGNTLLVAPDPDLGRVDLPPGLSSAPPPAGASADSLVSGPGTQFGDDGSSFLGVTRTNIGDQGDVDDFFLVKGGQRGERRTALSPALGQLQDVWTVAWDGQDAAWIAAVSPQRGLGVWRISLADGSATEVAQVRTGEEHSAQRVNLIVHDVALGGRSAATTAPQWSWHEPSRLRYAVAALRIPLILLAVGAAGFLVMIGVARRRHGER